MPDTLNPNPATHSGIPARVAEIAPLAVNAPSSPALELSTVSSSELMGQNLGEVLFLAEALLHQGLVILSADPKTGKSWLALDLCVSVAAGVPFLGFETKKGGALYLALEDSFRRLKGRLEKVLTGKGINAPSNLYFAIAANPIDQGLPEQLNAYMAAHPDTTLIVIDVLNRIRAVKRGGQRTAYEIDSAEFAQIKAIADKHNIGVLLIHHTRKGRDGTDVFQNISGSQGIIGCVDEGLMLTKEHRTDTRATLSITSREMGDKELIIDFDSDTFLWQFKGTAEQENERRAALEYNTDPVTVAIRGMMKANPTGFSTTAQNFVIDAVSFVNATIDASVVGKKFRAYAHYLYRLDRIKYTPGNSKTRIHSFAPRDNYHIVYDADPDTDAATSATALPLGA